MEPNHLSQVAEEGAKIMFMLQILCQVYFMCEVLYLHCQGRTERKQDLKFILAWGSGIS